MLCPSLLFACLPMSVFVIDIANKFKSPVQGHTKIPGGEYQRHEIQVKEKMMNFGCSYDNWDSGGNASICADDQWHFLCACTVVFPWKK